MAVDTSDILHVLAHELRTPVGIAQGYARLLLENRLPEEPDRRRALDQMQKALGRVSDLTHEATALAALYESSEPAPEIVPARRLLEDVVARSPNGAIKTDIGDLGETTVRARDAAALTDAIATVVQVTARELRGLQCVVTARLESRRRLEILAGAPDKLGELADGPGGSAATPMVLERGGLGLALVRAAVVLDAHGVERWTIHRSRQTAGLLIPAEEGQQQ